MNKRARNIWLVALGAVLVTVAIAWLPNQANRQSSHGGRQAAAPEDSVDIPAGSTDRQTAPAPPETSYQSPGTVEALQEEEIAVAKRLLEDLPDVTNSMALMGQVYSNQGNMDEAAKWLQKCLDMNPKRSDIYSILGDIALLTGEYQEAATSFQQALTLSPTAQAVHDKLAESFMGLGKISEAIETLEACLKASAGSSQTYWRLGQAYLQLKDYPEAKKRYEKAIAIQPDFRKAYYGLATACARLGQKDLSRQYMQQFQGLKDEHMKARADWILGSYDDLALARQSVAWTFIEVGKVYDRNQYPRKAEQLWQKATVLDPKNRDCRMHLALQYLSNSQPQKALEMCRQIGGIEPEKADTHVMTGIIHSGLKRLGDAERAFSTAIDLAPKHPEAYRRLANLYLGTNRNLTKARTLAETVVKLQPTAGNYETLCQARDRTGDFAGALSAIEKAIALDPENARYKGILQWMKTRK